VVLCLEQEVRKPKEQRKRVDPHEQDQEQEQDEDQDHDAGDPVSDSMLAMPGIDEMTVEPIESADSKEGLTDKSSNMKPITSNETKTRKSPVRQLSTATSEDSDAEKVERLVNIKECPLCHKPRMNSKAELDIITHMGICSSTDPHAVNRIVVNEFVTASQAHRKWFTKVISKATKGAYRLGADSANIIVQDRLTGALQEERMASYVRLGMRLAYRGFGPGGGMEGARIRRMLESMSYKQGVKFESPASVREIQPFINFHNLDMSEVLDPVSSFSKRDGRPAQD
jgi:phosphatidylserine decarboxylase